MQTLSMRRLFAGRWKAVAVMQNQDRRHSRYAFAHHYDVLFLFAFVDALNNDAVV